MSAHCQFDKKQIWGDFTIKAGNHEISEKCWNRSPLQIIAKYSLIGWGEKPWQCIKSSVCGWSDHATPENKQESNGVIDRINYFQQQPTLSLSHTDTHKTDAHIQTLLTSFAEKRTLVVICFSIQTSSSFGIGMLQSSVVVVRGQWGVRWLIWYIKLYEAQNDFNCRNFCFVLFFTILTILPGSWSIYLSVEYDILIILCEIQESNQLTIWQTCWILKTFFSPWLITIIPWCLKSFYNLNKAK